MSEELLAGGMAPPQIAKSRARGAKRLALTAGLLIAASALAAYGYDYFTFGQFIETTQDAYVGGNVTDIAASVSGQITGVNVTDNQFVHQGDLLVSLDHRSFLADFEKAEAAVAGAQASLNKLDAQARLSPASQLAVIAAERDEENAALKAAQADLDAAKLRVDDADIHAPFDGVVGNRSAHAGGFAAAGAPLLTIVPANGLWVDANFKEDQLARIHPGMTVRITPDIDKSVHLTGHVESVAPASGSVFSLLPAENATGNFTKIVQRVTVRIALQGEDAKLGLLRPGLSVTAVINTK